MEFILEDEKHKDIAVKDTVVTLGGLQVQK